MDILALLCAFSIGATFGAIVMGLLKGACQADDVIEAQHKRSVDRQAKFDRTEAAVEERLYPGSHQ